MDSTDTPQGSRRRRFIGGASLTALPTVGLALIGLIPSMWFFLVIALPIWFLGLFAVGIMRSDGVYAALGVLAGWGLGGAALCAAIYVNLDGVIGT